MSQATAADRFLTAWKRLEAETRSRWRASHKGTREPDAAAILAWAERQHLLTGEAADFAAELGCANRGTVYRVVSKALKTQTVEAVDQLRNLEVPWLDKRQFGLWQKAMNGDVPSVIAATRIIMARCHLLGLEGPGLRA